MAESKNIQMGGIPPANPSLDDVFFVIPDNPAILEILKRAQIRMRDVPELYKMSDVTVRKWKDNELYALLLDTMDFINTQPPMTYFGFDELYGKNQGGLMSTGIVYMALVGMAILENEEQMSYSDNGISLSINKMQGYSIMAQQVTQQFLSYLDVFKKTIRPKGRGLTSARMAMPLRINKILRHSSQLGGSF